VAPTFEQIEDDFLFWRNFVLEDLDRIVSQDTGGNFAAAALIDYRLRSTRKAAIRRGKAGGFGRGTQSLAHTCDPVVR